jgi:hypothetical protein
MRPSSALHRGSTLVPRHAARFSLAGRLDKNRTTGAAGMTDQEIAMNSIHRVGLTIASVATVATIAGAFVMQGYVAAQQAAAQTAAAAPAQSISQPAADTATTAPQIVYITAQPPAATPAPIVASAQQQPAIIHVVVPGPVGDDNGSDN